MAALDTVGKMVEHARTLLLDKLEPYRFSTSDLISYLNFALLDARRIRPDLFLATPTDVPEYTAETDEVAIDQQYRLALVYFMVGQAHLRDEEETADARAAAMLLKFTEMLTGSIPR